jgi:ABC-type polar amino acid transport system ATPase subunit
MKRAVIVVGPPNAGKSTTIKEFKKLVEMETFHIFILRGKRGYILSCSFEESGRDVESTIEKLREYDFLVFASQGDELAEIHAALRNASFVVADVRIQFPKDAPEKAREVLRFLNSN